MVVSDTVKNLKRIVKRIVFMDTGKFKSVLMCQFIFFVSFSTKNGSIATLQKFSKQSWLEINNNLLIQLIEYISRNLLSLMTYKTGQKFISKSGWNCNKLATSLLSIKETLHGKGMVKCYYTSSLACIFNDQNCFRLER